jgi:hypothetical protein
MFAPTYHYGKFRQDVDLPIRKSTIGADFSMLTGMVSKSSPQKPEPALPHYLKAHLDQRTPLWDQARLARELGTSQANVSRWCSYSRADKRGLDVKTRRRIESLWGLEEGELLRPPKPLDQMPQASFLADVPEKLRPSVIEFRDAMIRTEVPAKAKSRTRK